MMKYRNIILSLAGIFSGLLGHAEDSGLCSLTDRQKDIVEIASHTAKSDFISLDRSLNEALDNGMTVNEAKEVIVHTYAYCGFPKALRGLQTMIAVLDERTASGKPTERGREATVVKDCRSKYDRGREILSEISGVPADAPKAAYAELSPEIEVFLKEHLFCDLFERDVLTYAERELATVAVIASLGEGVEPMLRSHIGLAKRLGATDRQIEEIVTYAALPKAVLPKDTRIEPANQ